jgi:serine protease Do
MGVTVRPVTPVIAESYGYTGNASGALIETISDGSPAARAGLKQGDIILTVEGREIRSSNDLVNVVSAFRPSDKVKLELWRANRKTDVIVTLTERPDAGNDESSTPSQPEPSDKDDSEVQSLGLTVGPIPPDLRERLQELGHRGGVLIKDVDESSEAAREDVVRGLIVLDVNGTPTPTVEDFRKATAGIGAGKVVRMRLLDQRGNERLFFFRVGD